MHHRTLSTSFCKGSAEYRGNCGDERITVISCGGDLSTKTGCSASFDTWYDKLADGIQDA
jgi:hypothetical protein